MEKEGVGAVLVARLEEVDAAAAQGMATVAVARTTGARAAAPMAQVETAEAPVDVAAVAAAGAAVVEATNLVRFCDAATLSSHRANRIITACPLA